MYSPASIDSLLIMCRGGMSSHACYFLYSFFFKERKIDWHDLKGNTKELKRKEILMYKVEEN
jgi:hypothetical protein